MINLNLTDHIQFLLISHDCVIIPGFGAFVASRCSAAADGDCFISPKRMLSFNSEIRHDDGLLATSVARKEGIGYESAVRAISAVVRQWHQLLNNGEALDIPRVGRLNAEQHRICFTPDDNSIVSFIYNTLPSVTSAPLNIEKPEKKKGKGGVVYIPIYRSAVRVAASIAAILAIGLVCSTPNTPEDVDTYMASISSPTITLQEEFVQDMPIATSTDPGELFIARPTGWDRGIAYVDTAARTRQLQVLAYYRKAREARQAYLDRIAKQKEELEQARQAAYNSTQKQNPNSAATPSVQTSRMKSEEITPVTNTQGKHYVIVASFSSMKKAQQYVFTSKNRALGVVYSGCRYRVYAYITDTEEQAKAIASSPNVQMKYPGAWATND